MLQLSVVQVILINDILEGSIQMLRAFWWHGDCEYEAAFVIYGEEEIVIPSDTCVHWPEQVLLLWMEELAWWFRWYCQFRLDAGHRGTNWAGWVFVMRYIMKYVICVMGFDHISVLGYVRLINAERAYQLIDIVKIKVCMVYSLHIIYN